MRMFINRNRSQIFSALLMAALIAAIQASAAADRPAQPVRALQNVARPALRTIASDLDLARSEAQRGRYQEALALYDQVLTQMPANYDALQGKAFVLYWTHQLGAAQTIFERLARMNPRDSENQNALQSIAKEFDYDRWQAMRPREGAMPQAWLGYYTSYLADHPKDSAAAQGLARAEAQLRIYGSAVRADQRALRLDPSSVPAQLHLARELAWSKQYAASVEAYNELLRRYPRNREALIGLERVYEWWGRPKDALNAQQRLLALDPTNADDLNTEARLEIKLKNDPAAESALKTLLSHHPDNREALLQMAQLQTRQGRLRQALRYYDDMLALRFDDAEALYGEARIYYFLGDPERAGPLAARALAARPDDYDTLMLAARIERALRRPRQALALVHRAAAIDSSSPEAAALETDIASNRHMTVETTSTYAREQSFQNASLFGVRYPSPGLVTEDLNTYSSALRLGFSILPRSNSYVLLAATPSNSPMGGIQGAVAPAELMYGQTTRLSSRITLRGGIGGVRLGPGTPYYGFLRSNLTPVGYFGYSLSLTRKLSFDVTAARSAITYTPTSVRFGAVETSIEGGIRYDLNPRTSFAASFAYRRDFAPVYDQTNFARGGAVELAADGRDHGEEGTVTFTRNLIHAERFGLDAGYAGLAFGYAGAKKGVYMGFFNPAFYQSHFLATRAHGKIWGPFEYALIADAGFQQASEGAPFTRAFRLGPAISVRVSQRLSLTANYLHYNFAQSLGSVKGNAVGLKTDWRF